MESSLQKGETNFGMFESMNDPSPFASKASMKFGMVMPAIDRSSDLQALSIFLLAVASRSTYRESVHSYGGRSCSPLRDSSGFTPDSLVTAQAT